MAKRYAKKRYSRKRTTRTRSRRRRGRKSGLKALKTYVSVPCRVRIPLSAAEGDDEVTWGIQRLMFSEDSIMNGYTSFGQSDNWKCHRAMFEQFAVKGVSVRYMPANSASGMTFVAAPNTSEIKSSGLMEPIIYWEDCNDNEQIDIPDTAPLMKDSYRTLDVRKAFRRYYSNKALCKTALLPWRDTSDPKYPEDASELRKYTHYFRFMT